jgi:hypothetical protein
MKVKFALINMDSEEFLDFRGKKLVATTTWVGHQEFVLAAIPGDRQDAINAEIYAQQKIEIVPGLKVMEKKSGKEFEILSKPNGYSRLVTLKDTRRNLTPVMVPEDELRQNYRFVG